MLVSIQGLQMQLYFAPGACSLADHIALCEAALPFETVQVDLKTHETADGRDYLTVNPKGYVPTLVLDDGQMLTENIAILSWIGDQAPNLRPDGDIGRYRLLEMLAFVSTEIHKAFKPLFAPDAADDAKTQAAKIIEKRLAFIAGELQGDYLFGASPTVADAYLFVMLTWAQKNGLPAPDRLLRYVERMKSRPAVQQALREEGLS
jgi:glutathione S-transferase